MRNDNTLHIFRENMRARRLCLGMTQQTLAKKIFCSRSYISAIENGTRVLAMENLAAIADALQTQVHELLIDSNFVYVKRRRKYIKDVNRD